MQVIPGIEPAGYIAEGRLHCLCLPAHNPPAVPATASGGSAETGVSGRTGNQGEWGDVVPAFYGEGDTLSPKYTDITA